MNVAILGASDKPDRYAYKALMMLKDYNHTVFPVAPAKSSIEGVVVYEKLGMIKSEIDVLTLYIGAERLPQFVEEIIALNPKTVIFNPGTENQAVIDELTQKGIKSVTACTLVLLRTNQFDAIV